jgi:hypothetical protein
MAKVKTVEHVTEQRQQRVPDHEPIRAEIEEPTRAEIEERAYSRYVDRGRIDGFDGEDWHLAETELRGEQAAAREPAREPRSGGRAT